MSITFMFLFIGEKSELRQARYTLLKPRHCKRHKLNDHMIILEANCSDFTALNLQRPAHCVQYVPDILSCTAPEAFERSLRLRLLLLGRET